MPKLIKPLSDKEIKEAKTRDKQYKLYDGDGLSIIIFPNSKKKWRYDYTFNKKRSSSSLGEYPTVTLKNARDKRSELKKKIYDGINPSTKQHHQIINNEFKIIALEYFKLREDLSAGYIKDSLQKLSSDIFPYVGNISMDDIEPLQMLHHLQVIDKRGSNVSAKKTFSIVSRIYKYAVGTGKAKRNIMNDLDKSISFRTVEKKNFKHTTDINELKDILLSIDGYEGDYNTKMALKILPHLFCRPSNLRFMEWDEINLDKKVWTIPSSKMKTKKEHIYPLSDYVTSIIKEMKDISYGICTFVFPSRIYRDRSLSENTLNFGLKRMGLNTTAHGFRHTASTLLHENIQVHGFTSDIIEIQLAHSVGNSVHQVYNKAQYFNERTKLMTWWSDYLNSLKSSN